MTDRRLLEGCALVRGADVIDHDDHCGKGSTECEFVSLYNPGAGNSEHPAREGAS